MMVHRALARGLAEVRARALAGRMNAGAEGVFFSAAGLGSWWAIVAQAV
jgi:hypothetical protein